MEQQLRLEGVFQKEPLEIVISPNRNFCVKGRLAVLANGGMSLGMYKLFVLENLDMIKEVVMYAGNDFQDASRVKLFNAACGLQTIFNVVA